MPNFAANLSFLYTEHPMLERFAAAAEDGFRGVEMLFPYALPATTLAAQARAQGLQVEVVFTEDDCALEGGRCIGRRRWRGRL